MLSSSVRPIFSGFAFKGHLVRTITATSEVAEKETEQLKPWTEIPGPSALPVIGIIHHFMPLGKFYNLNGLPLMEAFYKDYGPIIRLAGIPGVKPLIALFDAESSSQVLRGENSLPVRTGFLSLEHYRKVVKNKNSGKVTGLITEHGDGWKDFRSTVNPVMLQPKTIRLYASVIDEVAIEMVERLRSIRDENNMIKGNFDQEMNKWSLESIGVVALGCRLNCLDPHLPDDSPAKRLIKCVHDIFVATDALEFKANLWKWISTPAYKKTMALYKEQETISQMFIDKAKEELKSKEKTDDEKGILEKLLEINEEYALIMATDMLLAGVDTAANSITAALYLLAKNPEKQEKLRKELLTDKEKRPYLRACMREAIRIMPVVSGNIRKTSKEYNILGYTIPTGTQVAFNHQFMSLMEDHYPRAKEFIPERWLVEKDDPLYYRNAHPFAYNPFGFGVRSCIGRRIAEIEMETFLARMVESFHIGWVGEPPKVYQTSLNYFKGPYNFIFKDINKEMFINPLK